MNCDCPHCQRVKASKEKKNFRTKANGSIDQYAKEILLKELETARGKLLLSSYHNCTEVDLSWIDHRIDELKSQMIG